MPAPRAPVPWRWLAAFAAIKLGATLAVAGRYGWHRDELYYLASAHHLGFGYVDYPPVVPLLAAADQALAPGSLVALRAVSVLAGAVIVVLTALIARELGATTRAQAWASLSALLSPVFVGANLLFQTVSFDQLWWALAILLFTRLLRDGNQRLWLPIGLVVGIGLETKFTITALPLLMLLSLLVSSRRGMLASGWPWAGAVLALLLFVPNLVWQAGHSWVSIQYTLSHRGHTDGPIAYWLQQLVLYGILLVVPGVAGLIALRRDSRFVPLVYLAPGIELFFFLVGGKSYYPAPVYPLVYAAGTIWLDERLRSATAVRTSIAAVVALTLVLLPIELPVLPTQTLVSLGLWETRKDYADMFGWPELAQQTAAAFQTVPAADRSGTVVLTQNYGEAGAIDLYGPPLGLPDAVSPHLTYFYWAPRDLNPSTVVLVGFSRDFADRYFTECRSAGTITNDLGIHNEEYGGLILVCTGPKQPLWKVWPSLQTLD